MTTRTKIASQEIENGVLTISYYGEADESGKQHVVDELTYDLTKLCASASPTALNVMAVGLGRIIEGRYNRANLDNPDVPKIAAAVWDAVTKGEWQPGRRESESEPSDLQTALAEVTGVPIHLIQERFETEMQKDAQGNLIRNKKGQTMRFFNKAYQAKLAADPEVAVILSRIERERAQRRIADAKRSGASSGLVKGLFGSPSSQAVAAQ